MGTNASDALYHSLSHPALSPRRESRIQLRWQEWLPFATMEARKNFTYSSAALEQFKTTHRSRLQDLLAARISWTTIRKLRLDSPLLTQQVFESLLRAAAERRRTRMGRVKGVKRGHR